MPKSSPPIYLVEALAREAYDSLPEEKPFVICQTPLIYSGLPENPVIRLVYPARTARSGVELYARP